MSAFETIEYFRRKAAQFRALAEQYTADNEHIIAAKMEEIASDIEAHVAVLEGKKVKPLAKLTDAAAYRVYLRDADGRIIGRDDFEADDDASAMAVASMLADACSDRCAEFELWQCTRRVEVTVPERAIPGASQIVDRIQNTVIEREVAMLESRWLIADSARLLEETTRLLSTRPSSAS